MTTPDEPLKDEGLKSGDTARINDGNSLSVVWIVPLVALLLAAWLGYQAWQEAGPNIEIRFAEASGIKEGKTEVRYKDVRVGLVQDVELDAQLEQVRVTAEMDPVVADHLTENTRFWLVKPAVGLQGITGLDTLLSGVYIGMDPGAEEGKEQRRFEALDSSPAVKSTDTGSSYQLTARELGSLYIGSPVYYRQVPVGEITGYRLRDDGTGVELKAFIQSPYDQWVTKNSRFWNASGIGMELNSQGMKANVASLMSLLAGGIAFKTPHLDPTVDEALLAPDERETEPAPEDYEFTLFSDEQAIEEEIYTLKYQYAMQFSGSVRGLEKGAPVELRGIKVGSVADVSFLADKGEIQVLIELEPQRLNVDFTPSREEMNRLLAERVEQGLKAQLKTGNLITGSLFVDLIKEPDNPGELVRSSNLLVIPTAEAQLDQVLRQFNSLMEKANSFPITEIGDELQQSMRSLRILLQTLEEQQTATTVDQLVQNLEVSSRDLQGVVDNANSTLVQAETTLSSLQQTLAPDAELHYQALQLIERLQRAANTVRQLAEELNRNPNALIFGKEPRAPE